MSTAHTAHTAHTAPAAATCGPAAAHPPATAPSAVAAVDLAVTARVVVEREDAEALVGAWDDLATACGAGFAARPAYGLAWWYVRGSGHLHVVTVHRGPDLVALAPLHRRRVGGRWVLRWLGHGLGTVGELLAVDDAAARHLRVALAEQGAPLELTHVRPDAPSVLALRRDPEWQVRLEVDDFCPVIEVPEGTTAAGLRSRATLKRLQRLLTSAARAGREVSFELVDDVDGLQRRWHDVVRVAALADAERQRTDLCADPWRAFTLPFLRDEAAAGRLVVVGLLVDGAWSAHQVALRTGPGLSVLQTWLTRFDPAVGELHPGHQLLRWLVDHAGELGVRTVDQLIGQNPYKLEWAGGRGHDVATALALPRATGSLELVAVQLAASRSARRAVRAGLRAAGAAGPRVLGRGARLVPADLRRRMAERGAG